MSSSCLFCDAVDVDVDVRFVDLEDEVVDDGGGSVVVIGRP